LIVRKQFLINQIQLRKRGNMKSFTGTFLFIIIMLLVYNSSFAQTEAGKVPGLKQSGSSNFSADGFKGGTIAYGHSSQSFATLTMPIPDGTPFDSLNSWTPGNFASSMVQSTDGNYYIITFEPALYQLNPATGAVTLLGAITGLNSETPNGITQHPATGTFYLATNLNLYSFNVSTRAATLIGPFNAGGIMIDLTISCNGICYGYDISDDNAYTINLTTGAATLIGPLGYDAGFGQGIDVDRETGRIYISAFNVTTFTGQLRTLDPATGNTTLVVDWGFEQVAPFDISNFCETIPDPPTGLNANPVSSTEIELTWTDNSDNEQGFEIQRQSGIFFIIIDTVGSNVTNYTDTERNPGTEYCYRVRAFNIAGPSSFTSVACATTISPPNAPTDLSAEPVSPIQIQLNWTDNADNETGFRIERKEGAAGTYDEIATVSADVTTYSDTGRTPEVEYCYRVQAFNQGGNSDFTPGDVCAATSSNFPGIPTLISPANDTTGVQIDAVLSWNAAPNAQSYGLQISLNSTFTPAVEIPLITATTFTTPNLAHNTRYYWRVNAANNEGTSDWSEARSFTTTATMDLNATITFPNKSNPGDYNSAEFKIIGLPGDGNINASSILAGTQGSDWELYDDNGADSNYYVKFNSTSPFRFTKGKAYWIIRKGDLIINNQSTNGVGVNSSGYAEITLRNGFNLITNPFVVAVNWLSVLTLNGLPPATPLYGYNGNWENPNTMQPFAGYLFDNSTNLSTLRIPYPFGTSSLPKQNNPDIWRVNIDLISGDFEDRTVSFGVSDEASVGRDKFDFRKPRAPGNVPMVYFNRQEWDNGYGLFATDMRPQFEDLAVWDFNVSSGVNESSILSFSGMHNIPEQMGVYLIDHERTAAVNLREQTKYEFTPVKSISEFRILVGKPESISSILDNLLPKEFELGSNFPNPFNPSTTFFVSVPQPSDIRIAIYNILGQEIKVLYEGSVDAGKHWYQWDGKNTQGSGVPSGVYLYNFTNHNGKSISKKMILMK
jgi:hypothetical protein